MNGISLFRLYLLRAVYLFIAVGLGIYKFPAVIHQAIYHEAHWGLMEGVVACMQVAFGLLVILGLRYPLQMLPVLLWEMIWKLVWLLIVALPLWSSGQMDASTMETVYACTVEIIPLIAIPWSYVFAQYIRKPGDRWRNATTQGSVGGEGLGG